MAASSKPRNKFDPRTDLNFEEIMDSTCLSMLSSSDLLNPLSGPAPKFLPKNSDYHNLRKVQTKTTTTPSGGFRTQRESASFRGTQALAPNVEEEEVFSGLECELDEKIHYFKKSPVQKKATLADSVQNDRSRSPEVQSLAESLDKGLPRGASPVFYIAGYYSKIYLDDVDPDFIVPTQPLVDQRFKGFSNNFPLNEGFDSGSLSMGYYLLTQASKEKVSSPKTSCFK